MDDVKVVHKETPEAPKPTKKSRKLKVKFNKTGALAIGVVVLVVAALFVGKSWGTSSQKKANEKANPFANRSTERAITNRFTSVGKVTAISDKSITVKDARDQEKTATVNGDTKIVDRKGKPVKVGDIAKDARVIMSGTKDEKDDKKLTATRIRLQQ